MSERDKPVIEKPSSLKYVDDSYKGGGIRYETDGYYGKKKHEVVESGGYRLVIVNGVEERDDWKVKKEIVPKKHITKLGNPIIIPVLDKNDNVVAVATGLGFAGGKNLYGNFLNGEVVISEILHADGSINEISDIRKFKMEIEHKERTVGEGKDKRSEIYTVLKEVDAKKLMNEVMMGKSGLTNFPGLQTNFEQSEKFPVAKVEEPHDFKSPSTTLVAGNLQKTNSLT
ncbi:MAG: hypothetical protein ABL867_03030 [Rickettsiales bacterium]